MSWTEMPLGQMTDPDRAITYGVVKPGPEDPNEGVRFVRGGDIHDGKIALDGLRTITQDVSRQYTRTLLRGGELLISLVGNPGEVAIAPDSLAGANIARQAGLIALKPDYDPRYVMYFLMSPAGRAGLFERTQGAVQQVINLAALKTVKIKLPSLAEQQRIAAILSAYDDLIENNRRRIALLEEAARQLFKEWFVRFRFPGHEHVKIIDGVPEGWETKAIEDVCDTIGGGTPSTKKPEYWADGDVLWFTPTDVTRNSCLALLKSEKFISESGLHNSSAKMIPPGSIMMTSRASVGFFGINRLAASTNQGFISIVPHEPAHRMYLLQNLMWRVEEIRSHAGGATYKEISKGRFRALPILIPSSNLASQFEEQCSLIHTQVETLHRANQQLAEARDLLLPKLMNGSLAV